MLELDYALLLLDEIEDALLPGDTDVMPMVRALTHIVYDQTVIDGNRSQTWIVWLEFVAAMTTMSITYAGSDLIRPATFPTMFAFIDEYTDKLRSFPYGR